MALDVPLLIFILGFAAILILRVPIAFGMLATAIFYFLAAGLDIGLVAEKVVTNLYSVFIIIAVPLFVFTAKVMNTSEVSDMIFTFAQSMVGKVRGGLGHVNVIASLIFSGMTGSAVADASGLGLLEVTQMRKRGLRSRVCVRDHRHFRDHWASLPAQYPDDLLCHALRRLHRCAFHGWHDAGYTHVCRVDGVHFVYLQQAQVSHGRPVHSWQVHDSDLQSHCQH